MSITRTFSLRSLAMSASAALLAFGGLLIADSAEAGDRRNGWKDRDRGYHTMHRGHGHHYRHHQKPRFNVSYRSAAPVYYSPRPVYYAPRPVYYSPAPVYYAPSPYYGGGSYTSISYSWR